MARRIIKQPNGLYAEWSTIVDDFVSFDCTPEDIIQDWIENEAKEIRKRVEQVVKELDEGGKPYFQFTDSFEDCIKRIKEVHGGDTESLSMVREAGLLAD
jgi:hypothetical protein